MYSGLVYKFNVNRSLSGVERAEQLKQKVRLDIVPHDQLSVIKLNSTYLETVDKWFAWKGSISALMLPMVGVVGAAYIFMMYVTLTRVRSLIDNDWIMLVVVTMMVLPFLGWAVWMLRRESFAFTHYPMRFNRKSRMVHIFRTDGTVMSVRWDQIFFTFGKLDQQRGREVRGHVMAADGSTVKETFALSHCFPLQILEASPGKFTGYDRVSAHWEFIRRYMDEGPQSVESQVQQCMAVHARRESPGAGMRRILANSSTRAELWVMFIPAVLAGLARTVAMRTSKIPQWPAKIEAACPIAQDDPYAIEGDLNYKRVAVFPEAARAAGVGFKTL
jgi:hypothetical protein